MRSAAVDIRRCDEPSQTEAGPAMRCPQCRHEGGATAKFCEGCGTKLVPPCPACGNELSPQAKFCEGCGQPATHSSKALGPQPRSYTPPHLAAKILRSRSALEGERKQVTVLFADVKGSMDLAEQVDPEEWHRVMDRFFGILSEGVHRFEGTINQYTGDGIMALFGAPIAHEDHAQRACYAALHFRDGLRRYSDELKRTKGLGFSVRMGLNSGEVVVGKIGDDLRMDYTAQGHTVGLASRMEQLADPGRICVTESTAALAAGFFHLRDLGPFILKGVRGPRKVFELEGIGPLRTRLEVSRARGFSRFVGRAEEMASLEAALARTVDGNCSMVGVVGEVGVGKSRLCYEFVERCRARGIPVSEAHGVTYGKAVPFLPVLELVRGYFGVTERDSDRTTRDKVAGRLLLLDDSFREVLPVLFDFLGVPDPERPAPRMEPEVRQHHLFALARRLVHARSPNEPAVMLFEDLHWFDGASAAFLEKLVDALPGTRTLMLVNFRPDHQAGWVKKSYYQQLPLPPLGPEAITELLRDLLGPDQTVTGLSERIRRHTAGNPFFIEEMVQALFEAGCLEGTKGTYRLVKPVEEANLPATVQAVLTARIDRLAEEAKQVLQAAAVIGKEFAGPVLERVVALSESNLADALQMLVGAEFIYEEALYPEAQYAFKHPLTQEVSYRTQLTERRARTHAAVARAIAELYPDRLDERAALLAHHWEQAGDGLEAARWSQRAADWAGMNDIAEAFRHWRRVRSLLERVPDSEETTTLGLAASIGILQCGWRVGLSEDEAATVFAAGRRLAKRSCDVVSEARLLSLYGTIRGLAGEVDEYLAYIVEGASLAEQTADAGLKLVFQVVLTYSHYVAGHLREALAFAERAVEQPPEDVHLGSGPAGFSPYLWLVMFHGMLLAYAGHAGKAKLQLDRVMEIAHENGEAEISGWAQGNYVTVARYTGEVEGVLDHARHGVETAEKMYSSFSRMFAYMGLGEAYVLASDWNNAVDACEKALAIARESRTGLFAEGLLLAFLAEARLGRAEGNLARATAEKAVAVAQQRGTKFFECNAHLALARVLLQTEGIGSRGKIEAALGQALALAEETGAVAMKPFVHEEQAQLARSSGDDDAWRSQLLETHRLFSEMGATTHVERVAKELRL